LQFKTVNVEFARRHDELDTLISRFPSRSLDTLSYFISESDPCLLLPQDLVGLSELMDIRGLQTGAIQFKSLKWAIDVFCSYARFHAGSLANLEINYELKEAIDVIAHEEIARTLDEWGACKNTFFILSNIVLLDFRINSYYRLRSAGLRSVLARVKERLGKAECKGELKEGQVALMETGDYATFDRVFSDRGFLVGGLVPISKIRYQHYAAFYFGARESLRLDVDSLNGVDLDFWKYVNSKTVAVVGPCSNSMANGPEIDSFDIVVKFNFKGFEGFAPETFGERCDVAYYINSDLKKIIKSYDFKDISSGLKFICHRQFFSSLAPDYGVEGKSRRFLYDRDGDMNPFFKSSPNAVQKCLLDLLLFKPSRVKLFNINLYIEDTTVKAYRNKSPITPHSFITHDKVSNFVFLQHLFKHGYIETDVILSSILSGSEEHYVECLQKNFGHVTNTNLFDVTAGPIKAK